MDNSPLVRAVNAVDVARHDVARHAAVTLVIDGSELPVVMPAPPSVDQETSCLRRPEPTRVLFDSEDAPSRGRRNDR